MISDQEIEQELQAKGLNAPRLNPDQISETIVDELYYVFPNTTTTICGLLLKNGFIVTGDSSAVSPENFNEEIGRKIARQHALDKIWILEGYLLKQRMSEKK